MKLQSIARIPKNASLQSIMPRRNTLRQTFSQMNPVMPPGHLLDVLRTVLHSVEGITIMSCGDIPTLMDGSESVLTPLPPILVHANQNAWSRSARRKKVLTPALSIDNNDNASSISTGPSMLKCLIGYPLDGNGQMDGTLEVSWIQGRDRALFESFWNHACRKVGGALESESQSVGR